MSLGQQLAPHLPFLRRYSRTISGSQSAGDALVRSTLEAIVASPDDFPTDQTPRVGLYRVLEEIYSRNLEAGVEPNPTTNDKLARQLRRIPDLERRAMLLSSLEGFQNEEIAHILDVPIGEAEALVASALAKLRPSESVSVLIVDPEFPAATLLGDIAESLGHRVVGIVDSEDDAVSIALRSRPEIIISETRLTEGSGLEVTNRIASTYSPVLMFVSNHPEDLLAGNRPEPTFLITKPFERATVEAAISQALFYREADEISPPVKNNKEPLPEEVQLSLVPTPHAPKPEVRNGRLELPRRPSQSGTGLPRLNALRDEHRLDAERILSRTTNLPPTFRSRLERAAELLGQDLDENSSLRLANQAEALAYMREAIADELVPENASDINAFVNALILFSRQFPAWREFVDEARTLEPLSGQLVQPLAEIAHAVQSQPDSTVASEVKEAIQEASLIDPDFGDAVTSKYFQALMHNTMSAVGAWLIARKQGISKSFNEAVDEGIGKGLAHGLASLLMAASTPLLVLMNALPGQYAWVGPALAVAKLFLGRR